MMNDQALTPTQIRTIFYVIKKHKWKITTLFLSTVVTVAVGSLLATPIYRASSKLMVKLGREDLYVSPASDSRTVFDWSGSAGAQKINAEIAILKSPTLTVQLVDHLGVQWFYSYPDRTLKAWPFFKGWLFKETKKTEIPPIEKAHKSVGDSIEVSNSPKSNVIDITFDWPDPVIAADGLNNLVDLYISRHVEVHTNPETYNLLKDQAEKWEKKLRKSEKDLEAFKRRHSITSLPQQRTMLLERLSETESQEKQTESGIQETEEMIASLKAQHSQLDQKVQLQETTNTQSQSATLAALKARLVDLELQGLKEEINRVKQMIAEEEKKEQKVVVSGKSPIRQSLKADLMKAKARLEALKAKGRNQKLQINTYREKLKALDGFEKQMKELQRQVTINERNYNLYLTKFEEAKISVSMDRHKIANVSVIEPARPPLKPIKPQKRRNVLIGGFLSLFAGIGMAFLIEFIHPVFRTREDIDQFLGLRVLATLPKEK